ncbi:GNAT family N-acetyltransferase [Actinoallomurus spadix]|uniref:BioF2-like acetyltransferase domain-containing protein n=1 Tax=Actinoallomurus spadix TaxID=79912 RepID=A0ABP3FI88_9ACTN|nr:GNAT family N-acetyltransferase [Actinoallomurus spadix]MCO5985840.1 GNAT family N-acetyltransferase [Actinoallomurus spadix]
MTDSSVASAEPVLDQAVRAAEAAAGAAGVSVRELTDIAELTGVVGLFATIWGRSANPPVTIELLRAFTKAGNYVAGAFDGDRLIGACVGFFAPAGGALHSHIAGVSPAAAGRSVGFALKLHQRAWAMLRGVSEIAWTFDPLVARNAYFNLVKLAARPVEYLPNFYGPMVDAINSDGESDRLLVRWPLRDTAVALAGLGGGTGEVADDEMRAGAVLALGIAEDGSPVPGSLDGATSLVAVPPDITALRTTEPELARRWRLAVREALTGLAGRGGRIDGFDRTGWYIVRRES